MKKLTKIVLLVTMALFVLTSSVVFSLNITKEWGSPVEVYDDTFTASTSYTYATATNLNGSEGAQVQVEYNSAGTTDDFIVSVFASLDNSTWDTTEYFTIRCDNNASAASQITFIVRDLRYFRIGIKGSGATDNVVALITVLPWAWDYIGS